MISSAIDWGVSGAPETFLVDANGGMTVETALRMLRLLPAGLDFTLEAPCATWRECVALRRRTDVAIFWDELATDEASIAQLIADDAAEGIGLKISKTGGLTRGRRQRDMCIAAGLAMSVQETADGLAIPEATVRTRLFRARALLREALARDLDAATVDVFGFAGERCDRIVAGVLAALSHPPSSTPSAGGT